MTQTWSVFMKPILFINNNISLNCKVPFDYYKILAKTTVTVNQSNRGHKEQCLSYWKFLIYWVGVNTTFVNTIVL